MSVAVDASTPLAPTRPRVPVRPVTFPRLVAAEWVKFRSLRSTFWTLGAAVVLMVALAVLQTWGTSTLVGEMDMPSMGGTAYVTGGYFLGQIAFCVLGVLIITGEYSTGMVRSTFAAAPTRLPVLWAKLVVVVTAVFVVSVVAVALSWAGSAPFFDTLGASVDLTRSEDLRILLGTPLFLAASTGLAYALGALIRHSAGALATVLGLLLVVETAFAQIPWRPLQMISPFLPSTAGSRLLYETDTLARLDEMAEYATLTPWQGFGVLVAWVAVLLAVAAVLLRRRDA